MNRTSGLTTLPKPNPLRTPYLFRTARFVLGFKLTPLGRGAAVLLFFSAMGLVTVDIPIYQIFCGLVALLGAVEFTGTILGPRLSVRAEIPAVGTVGEPILGTVRVVNQGMLPAFDLMAGIFRGPSAIRQVDADEFLPHLPRNAEAAIPVRLVGIQRGVYQLPGVNVHSTFPMNFMRFGGNETPRTTLTVVPRYHALEEFVIPFSNRYQPGGVTHVNGVGQSPEYLGNREYVAGEPVRRLDFRAWARLGRPVVREYQEEYYCRVALVLDTFVPARWTVRKRVHPEFEAAVSLMAAVAEAIDHENFAVDIFAAGPEMYVFRSQAGQGRLDAVLEILAGVDVCRRNPFEHLTPALEQNLESISTVVCLLLDWDESRRQFVEKVAEAGCATRVLVVRAQPPTEPLPALESYSQVDPAAVARGDVRVL